MCLARNDPAADRIIAFWENRVSAAGIPSTQTRIPEDPDQTEFVQRWFEFHQGYRTVRREDRSEHRVAVVGEPLKDVTPGHLPRTLDELRNGITTSSAEQELRTNALRAPTQQIEISQPVQSLEDTLDDLLEQAIAEEEEQSATLNGSQEALIPENVDARLVQSNNAQPDEHMAFQSGQATEVTRRGLRRRERHMAMLRRVFGTPEEIQSEEYVSPITSMFNRAWERHRRLQELRRAQESLAGEHGTAWWALGEDRYLQRSPRSEGEAVQEASSPEIHQHLATREGVADLNETAIGNMQRHREPAVPESEIAGSFSLAESGEGPDLQAQRPSEQHFEELHRGTVWMAARAAYLHRMIRSQPMFAGLDGDDRPEPLTDEQMTVKLECKICLTQKADIACIPCGHLSMCNWCADQAIPVRESSVIPKDRRAQCPVCRKGVKQRVKIFTS